MASHTSLALFALFAFIAAAQSATIKWSGAGGNPRWNYPQNWDAGRTPTINDDVVVDLPFTGGASITISEPATCGQLTIGGSSGFSQSVIVQSTFTIGTGGVVVSPNGKLTILSNPSFPFTTAGDILVEAPSGLVFQSGSLSGPGAVIVYSAASAVFGTAAEKQLSLNFTNGGQVSFDPCTLNLKGGQFYNYGTATASGALNILGDDTALFQSFGTFQYTGATSSQWSVQAPAIFSSLTIVSDASTPANIQILNNFEADSLTLPSSAAISILGAGINTFGTVTGSGSIALSGGTNTFAGVVSGGLILTMNGGTSNFNSKAQVAQFTSVSGTLGGSGVVSVLNARMSGGFFVGTVANSPFNISIYTLTLDAQGSNIGLDNAVLTLDGQVKVVSGTQLSFAANSQLLITPGTQVAVGFTSPFSFVLGDQSSPKIINHGLWTTQSPLTFGVDVTGDGIFECAATTLLINNVGFTATLVTLHDTSATIANGNIHIGTINGTGSIDVTAQTFALGVLASRTFTLEAGTVSVNGVANVGTLQLKSGVFTLGALSGNVFKNIDFQGGSIISSVASPVSITTGPITLTTGQAKQIDGVVVEASSVTFNCGTEGCTFQTLHGAALHTTGK